MFNANYSKQSCDKVEPLALNGEKIRNLFDKCTSREGMGASM